MTPESSVFVMPKNVSVNHGESVTFMCVVDVAGSYQLQWSHNGEELPGENQTLLTVNDVFATQGGTYTCSVVNVAGSGMDEGILYGMCNAIHDFRLVMHLLSIKTALNPYSKCTCS